MKYKHLSYTVINENLEVSSIFSDAPTRRTKCIIYKVDRAHALKLMMVKNFQKEARRRRAERALSANSDFKSRMIMCVASWCDITERKGIILVLRYFKTHRLLDS